MVLLIVAFFTPQCFCCALGEKDLERFWGGFHFSWKYSWRDVNSFRSLDFAFDPFEFSGTTSGATQTFP